MGNSFETENGTHTYHRGASMSSHQESVRQVLYTMDIYYGEYSKLWLTPIKDNPFQNEKNRLIRMGMKIMCDLMHNHYTKGVVDAESITKAVNSGSQPKV